MPKYDFSNFIEITLRHGCSPINLQHIFRTLFLKTPLDGYFSSFTLFQHFLGNFFKFQSQHFKNIQEPTLKNHRNLFCIQIIRINSVNLLANC